MPPMPPMPPIPPMPPAGVGAGVVGRSVTTASVVRTLWLGQDATGTTNFQMATTSWLNMIFDVIFCWTRCEHYFEHHWLSLNGNSISSNLEYKIISMIMYLNIPAWKEVRYRWVLGLLPCPQWRRHWPRNLWPPHGASALENITRTKKKSKKTTKHRCLFEFRRIIQSETSTNVTNSIPGWCGIASLHLGRVDDTGFQQIFIDLTAAKST